MRPLAPSDRRPNRRLPPAHRPAAAARRQCRAAAPAAAAEEAGAAAEAGAPSEAVAAAGSPAVFSGWASAVQLLWGDATQHPVANYTHVYVFDRVFAKHTMLALALQLQAAPFFVLASYRPPTEWSKFGLTKAAAVARIPMRTSGKETVTCWVYVNTHFLALSGGRARRPARAAPSARVGAADFTMPAGYDGWRVAARPAVALEKLGWGEKPGWASQKRLVAHLGPDGSWQLGSFRGPEGGAYAVYFLALRAEVVVPLRADAYGLSWLIIEKTEAVAALMPPQPPPPPAAAAAAPPPKPPPQFLDSSDDESPPPPQPRAPAPPPRPQFSAGGGAARAPPPPAAGDAAGPTPPKAPASQLPAGRKMEGRDGSTWVVAETFRAGRHAWELVSPAPPKLVPLAPVAREAAPPQAPAAPPMQVSAAREAAPPVAAAAALGLLTAPAALVDAAPKPRHAEGAFGRAHRRRWCSASR